MRLRDVVKQVFKVEKTVSGLRELAEKYKPKGKGKKKNPYSYAER